MSNNNLNNHNNLNNLNNDNHLNNDNNLNDPNENIENNNINFDSINSNIQTWEDLVRDAYRYLHTNVNEINNEYITDEELLDILYSHDHNQTRDLISENYENLDIDYQSELEEDSDVYNPDYIKTDKYSKNFDEDQCPNDSIITLTPYNMDDDELCIIKIQNSDGIFKNGICFTRNELRQWIKSDLGALPLNIMSIFTKPRVKENLLNGCSGKATGRLVVKLPDQMYITLGSFDKLLHDKNKVWYALPLFGGQRRRVGNLASICGQNMNHGQIPGFKIYKIFNRTDIQNGVVVKETHEDYRLSLFMADNITPLINILGLEDSDNIEMVSTLRDIVFQKFTDGIIKNLLR